MYIWELGPDESLNSQIFRKIMKRTLLLAAACITAAATWATTYSCKYFAIDTPDDSWQIDQNHALGEMGARIMVSRNDGTNGLTHLARIDYIDRPFTPASYLQDQVVDRRDNFAHSAKEFSGIADTTFAGYAAKYVKFEKEANGTTYNFTAVAFNAGFGTVLVIQGQQSDAAAIVGRITSTIKPVVPAQPQTLGQLVEASKASLDKRRATWDDNGEKLISVTLPDATTVQLDMEIPFVTREAIVVPTFVQAKRKQWIKHRKEVALRCSIVEMAVKEGRSIKYVYHESKGAEIGSMLILPEEVR